LTVHGFPQEAHSISLIEAIALAVLMKKVGAKRVFEFGTHRGVSTSQLVSNLPADGGVITLDLPRTDRRTQFAIDNPGDIEVSQMPVKADLIPSELRGRVRFLEQDSATFDAARFAGQMDFVFVDGAHTAEYVKNDSEKAWTMLRAEGIVAWHDCRPQTPDVVRYLRHCSYSPKRVVGGTIAFAVKTSQEQASTFA
jgi:predicted O-methyltransferase YrrM